MCVFISLQELQYGFFSHELSCITGAFPWGRPKVLHKVVKPSMVQQPDHSTLASSSLLRNKAGTRAPDVAKQGFKLLPLLLSVFCGLHGKQGL